MDLHIWGLVLFAAMLHAGWNALVKVGADRVVVMALVACAGSILSAGALPFIPLPSVSSLPLLGLSLIIHLIYMLFLTKAYAHGDFGHVYPIARGLGPVLTGVGAAVLIGEIPPPGMLLAIGLIALGVFSLALRGGPRLLERPKPVFYAVMTGVCIASYTLVDGVGGRMNANPLSFVIWLMALDGFSICAYALATRRKAFLDSVRRQWRMGMLGGAMSVSAFTVVVWAMSQGDIAPVAALRETSVIFAGAISALVMKERFGPWRIAATVMVAAGVVCMRLT